MEEAVRSASTTIGSVTMITTGCSGSHRPILSG